MSLPVATIYIDKAGLTLKAASPYRHAFLYFPNEIQLSTQLFTKIQHNLPIYGQ